MGEQMRRAALAYVVVTGGLWCAALCAFLYAVAFRAWAGNIAAAFFLVTAALAGRWLYRRSMRSLSAYHNAKVLAIRAGHADDADEES